MSALDDGRTALLLLGDTRFPSGAHAHSAGMEQAVACGAVRDVDDVAAWAEAVLWTTGLTAAGLAASGASLAGRLDPGSRYPEWHDLDAEADARTPSPAQRATARRLGRQLVRTARRVWDSAPLELLGQRWPDGPHRPVAFGAVVAAAGGGPEDAATAEAYGTVAVPVSAAVRLLGLDPVSGTAVVARLAPGMEEVAATAAAAATGPRRRLPARSAPMVDLYAEMHAAGGGALFAS